MQRYKKEVMPQRGMGDKKIMTYFKGVIAIFKTFFPFSKSRII